MRVLIVTRNFEGPERQPWLLDDLASALVRRGHTTDVLVADPTRARPRGEQPGTPDGLTVMSVGTTRTRVGSLEKLIGYAMAGFGLHTQGARWVSGRHYHLCVFTTPACFSWGFPNRVRQKAISSKLVLFLWDFFPIHQIEIGRIKPGILVPIMKVLERVAFQEADAIGVMSPASEKFLRAYHPSLINRTIEIPPWASSGAKMDMPKTDSPLLTVIFGGQISKGRGIDTLLDAAEILQDNQEIEILIAGDGPERKRLESSAVRRFLRNVRFLGNLPREDYRKMAAEADVGIAVTVPGISPPSFPSKIVEYCSIGLPVLVCTENASDAGGVVASHGAGLSVPAGDAQALAAAMTRLRDMQTRDELQAMGRAARNLFETRMSVERAVDSLERVAAASTWG